MAKNKLDEKTMNGVYRKGNDFFCVQWYPIIGSFYIIFNGEPGRQGCVSLSQLKKLIKDGWVKGGA